MFGGSEEGAGDGDLFAQEKAPAERARPRRAVAWVLGDDFGDDADTNAAMALARGLQSAAAARRAPARFRGGDADTSPGQLTEAEGGAGGAASHDLPREVSLVDSVDSGNAVLDAGEAVDAVNAELASLGMSSVQWQDGQGKGDAEDATLARVACVSALIRRVRTEARRTSESEDEVRRTRAAHSRVRAERDELAAQLVALDKQKAYVESKLEAAGVAAAKAKARSAANMKELERQVAQLRSRDAHYTNRMRKKEAEYQRLQDSLRRLVRQREPSIRRSIAISGGDEPPEEFAGDVEAKAEWKAKRIEQRNAHQEFVEQLQRGYQDRVLLLETEVEETRDMLDRLQSAVSALQAEQDAVLRPRRERALARLQAAAAVMAAEMPEDSAKDATNSGDEAEDPDAWILLPEFEHVPAAEFELPTSETRAAMEAAIADHVEALRERVAKIEDLPDDDAEESDGDADEEDAGEEDASADRASAQAARQLARAERRIESMASRLRLAQSVIAEQSALLQASAKLQSSTEASGAADESIDEALDAQERGQLIDAVLAASEATSKSKLAQLEHEVDRLRVAAAAAPAVRAPAAGPKLAVAQGKENGATPGRSVKGWAGKDKRARARTGFAAATPSPQRKLPPSSAAKRAGGRFRDPRVGSVGGSAIKVKIFSDADGTSSSAADAAFCATPDGSTSLLSPLLAPSSVTPGTRAELEEALAGLDVRWADAPVAASGKARPQRSARRRLEVDA